jgi:hypothetical protein
MNIRLTVASGGDAAIVENDGDQVTLRSSVPSPPGSTLALLHESLAIQVKVRGCKRLTEESLPFRIEGRFVSLTRVAREKLFGP